ncbi:hypothetical protein ACFWMQ_06695 [Streptomyces sp. NPDC058372]|uniref:helix-turn-helix domain-containing protein n=1 Tax=Streptomyces sp. NPDC058372 TaxID=3346464 RepID=UPI00365D6DF1
MDHQFADRDGVLAGLDPVEALDSFAAVGAAPVEVFASRGWSPAEWEAARARLAARGLVDASGAATEAGRALRAEAERRTDEVAAGPWRALTDGERDHLTKLRNPSGWRPSAPASCLLPGENTLGIGRI